MRDGATRRLKAVLRAVMAQTPYRVIRHTDGNRFQAIESSLLSLSARGFRPRLVIDGGAHLGEFSLLARRIFPDATIHLFEPQPTCAAPLRTLCTTKGFVLHECALADADGTVRFSESHAADTGAQVMLRDGPDIVPVRACRLDGVFGAAAGGQDGALLKLDLQGYELHALRGGLDLLHRTEVVLTEVSFFIQEYAPRIAVLSAFLDECGFDLYDIASLSARPRDNRARQGDFIFVRKDSPLLRDTRWE